MRKLLKRGEHLNDTIAHFIRQIAAQAVTRRKGCGAAAPGRIMRRINIKGVDLIVLMKKVSNETVVRE